ncbi:MAG: Gfo/Idh/MocA family protein [Halobacteriaceae archaeon]
MEPNTERDYAAEYDDHGRGIAVVGAGAIVEAAHLPAYRRAGFDVRGVMDADPERAATVADDADRSLSVYEDLDAVLDDPAVDVVDVAVPPQYQYDIVERVVESGRHVLCQKPLAESMDDARALVSTVEDADVTAAVNQQMRWQKSVRAVGDLLESGALGEPLRAKIEVNIDTDWSGWDWLLDAPRLEVMFHSLHYLDALRFLLGDPERVRSTMARAPYQEAAAETRTLHVLEYPGDLFATVDVNHNNWADAYAEFRVEGTEGVVRGTIGLFDDYPEGAPDTFEYRLGRDAEWESRTVPDAWVPDAFVGPMGTLLAAAEDGGRPPTHPADNLDTLRLANATYKSAATGAAVDPATVTDDWYPDDR